MFNFADYTPAEMAGMLRQMAITRGFELAEELDDARLLALVQRCVKAGEAAKGNGRLVRNLVERAIARQTDRVFAAGTMKKATLTTLLEDDFEAPASAEADDQTQTALARLDGVVGLKPVKLFVRQLMAQLTLQARHGNNSRHCRRSHPRIRASRRHIATTTITAAATTATATPRETAPRGRSSGATPVFPSRRSHRST